MSDTKKTGLDLLRQPFPPNQISKLPKPTRQQTEALKADFRTGIRCGLCGTWHHKDVVHLDYVGHAALTDRLLDADPNWQWEPLALDEQGLPRLDRDGGLWIKLTVCGVTRMGYGDAQGKSGGDAMKERIGDALRNAAMRFGAALDLWHKGELHAEETGVDADKAKADELARQAEQIEAMKNAISDAATLKDLQREFARAVDFAASIRSRDAQQKFIAAKDARKANLMPPTHADAKAQQQTQAAGGAA